MQVVEAVRNWLLKCPLLVEGSPLRVDYLDKKPTSYEIQPLPGDRIAVKYADGGSLREFPFAFNAVKLTMSDIDRMEANGFFEAIADYLEEASGTGNLPELGGDKYATEVSADSWGARFEGDPQTGVYQIICKLKYYQRGV